ncbi:MAG: DNA phosphorothioation-associated DGQHR protein 1 [Sulfuritalea sp.]|nr:DNA phosphorothioation-associated DGQHR protein 1 [Sulfuritalea sp.]
MIEVEQPLGVFYIVALPARALLDTAFSNRLKASKAKDGETYTLEGSQRELHEPRLKEIAVYTGGEESAFPNSIILAANFHEDGQIEEDEDLRWRVEQDSEDGRLFLVIPSATKLAPIVDGQHRLFSFNYVRPEKLDMPLVCAVFLDLPKPFQAFLFATINSTQKPVNRSLTYELFGYNIDNEPAHSWSPDKLAVFLARKLNTDKDSPLKRRILVAAENDFALTRPKAKQEGIWVVSMSTIVEGIARLFSQNPKRDGALLLHHSGDSRNRKILPGDKSPLRQPYLETNDILIYTIVLNFLKAADRAILGRAKTTSFVLKTVGIQALFDILRQLADKAMTSRNIHEDFFYGYLQRAKDVDFSSQEYKNASGSGRQLIRTTLEGYLGLKEVKAVKATN